ncbi:MAG: SPW repeat protein [Solirubrobacterales bacterium]|nr:SPW repeat protein [Solirubrobacterales bacterium]
MKLVKDVPGIDRRSLAGVALITWVAASPWLWGFADSRAAVANHVFLVLSFGPLVLLIVPLRAAALVTIAGGFWLVLSPWTLGYATDHLAWLNELASGLLLVVLALGASGLRQAGGARRMRLPRSLTAAGTTGTEPIRDQPQA